MFNLFYLVVTIFALSTAGLSAFAADEEEDILQKPRAEFDSIEWKKRMPRLGRSGMVGDLVRNQKTIGMSRARIRELLGAPEPIEPEADKHGSSKDQDSYALTTSQCGNAPVSYLNIVYSDRNVVKSVYVRTETLGSETKFSKSITENLPPQASPPESN